MTPAAPPPPKGILVPEATALSGCLRSAVVKTGQIMQFHVDTRKLGIHRYTPYPPRTLTSSLGREVEKYSQLCDAIQSQLRRAMTVLQRDLKREQDRIKAAEAEAAARAAAAAAPPPQEDAPLISPTQESEQATISPTTQSQKMPGLPARRQSTISLSSLHRPPFPHKLDLSAAGLRMDPNDPLLQPGLSSPVTLAPKSSISKVAPDFTFGPAEDVDIDLTLGDDVVQSASDVVDAAALGSSADKPIELDLDMELFGDPHTGGDMTVGGSSMGLGGTDIAPKQEQIDLDLFGLEEPSDSAGADAELLAAAQAIPPHADPSAGPTQSGSDQAMMEAINAAAAGLGQTSVDENFDFSNFDPNFSFAAEGPVDASVADMQMQDLFDMNTNVTDPRPHPGV
ncbi:hypothetical protein PsYK624_039760 [Phanerochaete sordida]|uniref:Uncharacterized protein n=1 Tax=Phanerochaete sordida TaxID=48140 RepID=A0A9P3G2L6_9APHY|nr:hypothetical protein PsYK624_039760 [Phanerochaete sordida]